jgi:hypothetical protein
VALDAGIDAARETFACLIHWLALHEDPCASRVRDAS